MFITAHHTLASAQIGDNVLFKRGEEWIPFTLTSLWADTTGYDACAFVVDNFRVPKDARTKTGGALFPGEPMKFLGFPHGLAGNYPDQGFPTPLVRTAYFSGVIVIDGLPITILDGFNNPGFSGGPVYVTHENETSLFAIISGYRFEKPSNGRVYKNNASGVEEIVPDIYTKPNSGMINSIGIEHLKISLLPAVDSSLDRY